MFKVGNIIKCICKPDLGAFTFRDNDNCVGKFYKVKANHPIEEYIQIENEFGWFDNNLFTYKKELNNEIDYLNAFQQNFKEGV